MASKGTRANENGHGLAAAMALLIQTQAQSVRDLAESRKEFAEIRRDLDIIKAVLVRHEAMLEKLPEAIREKIGFKN